ncbi:ubiquinone anaerobic biosynthesis protein UbiU [Teredinibacter franksiae]|jgi:Collagenase and related proteases|uniref:ubiquinone anaerobic biosynthesis protein UbiU n=1 Tax=Teredinibacter franksiae TaxID=2761453 RepID=UPI0016279C23|nr:peptidase U32 family protein [Teredinibacter franksiae]
MELVCPAGSLPAFKAAVEEGADAIYVGFKDDTNARHFTGLNFNDRQAQKALSLARSNGVKLYVAINTYPQPAGWQRWQSAVDNAVALGADAIIIADMGLMDYARNKYPQQTLHLSVQGSSTNVESLRFYKTEFDIARAVLPRVLSIKQVEQLCINSPVDLEVFGFGSLCIMVEGRCVLSSYITGESPNTCGVCSPAKSVRWEEVGDVRRSRLNNVLIDQYQPDEHASYPTLCKGRFNVEGNLYHALEQPTSLSTLALIPQLSEMGIKAIKLEGRQRSPAYVEQVVRVWRDALDSYKQKGSAFTVASQWVEQLDKVSEGSQTSLGPYSRPWQ